MGVSSVVGIFEPIVDRIALLICFQSMILDMAGNVGTQSLAVTIRVLMDEGHLRDAEAGVCIQGNANRIFKWTAARSASFVVIGIFIHIYEAEESFLLFCTFRLCRHLSSDRDGDLQPGRRTGADAVSQAEG